VQIERCLDACRDLQVLRAEFSPASHPAFYKLAIQVLSSGDRSQLDRISALARQRGVAVDPAFTALHLTHGRSRYRSCGTFENAERFHHQLLTLHHPVLLGGESHLRPLCAILQSALSESTR
jgi:dTDP-4-amino-4,6-dideoxygalactose transaminase